MSYVAAGVGLATTAYKVYDSVHKQNQAKKLARENKRPVFTADGSIREVKDLAASELSSTQLQDYTARQLAQNTSTAIDAVLKSGGKMDFATVHQTYGNDLQAALNNLARERGQRVAAYNNAAYNYAQSENSEFQYNKDAPYKDIKQQEAQLRQQSEQSKADAFSHAASTAGGYLTAITKPGEYGVSDGLVDKPTVDPAKVDPVNFGSSFSERTPSPIPQQGPDRSTVYNNSLLRPPNYVAQGAVNKGFLYYDHLGNPVYQ